MREIERCNDPVRLSWIVAILADQGIDALVLDNHTSVLEGSIGAIQRRVVVADDDVNRAERIVAAADRDNERG